MSARTMRCALLNIHWIGLSLYSCVAVASEVPEWRIVMGESNIRFVATQAGAEFEGGFDAFDAQIRFDPLDLAHSSVRVEIDVSSVNTRSPDRDEVLRSLLWFHPERWPRATFRATEFREVVDGYEAEAELTIRNVTHHVLLTFALVDDVRLDGHLTIKRLKFGLGEGEWADTTWIGDEVKVVVRVVRDLDASD